MKQSELLPKFLEAWESSPSLHMAGRIGVDSEGWREDWGVIKVPPKLDLLEDSSNPRKWKAGVWDVAF